MGYTTDEISVIDGVLWSQMLPRSGSKAILDRYLRIHRHIQEDSLDHADLLSIREMLSFLFPVFYENRQFQKDLLSALTKTTCLLKSAAS